MTRAAVIVGYRRSPFHAATKGGLASVRPDDLVAKLATQLVEDSGIDPKRIEDLILGCAFPEGEQGLNMARMVVLLAGLPISIAGTTINRYCGSSMEAVHKAAASIAVGSGDAFLACGVESMSRVPVMGFNPLPHPGLADRSAGAYMSMGQTAENLAKTYGIERTAQESFALESHKRAAAAWDSGRFADEVVGIDTKGGVIAKDGTIRPETSLEALAGLKPAFAADGSVTAGTSSPLTDGAAACLVVAEEVAVAEGLPILARIKSMAVDGCAPEAMGLGPVGAARKALDRAGLTLDQMDVIELNEAFAAQVLAVCEELDLDPERINRDGGAIALGHPLGASGARITGKAAAGLKTSGGAYALAMMCIGGGQGIATVLEAV